MSRELKPLRLLLAQAVDAARLSPATVARALDVSTRAWERLLSGEHTLRVRHLLALAKLLGVPPEDFLEAGLPEASRTAERRLADWTDPARPREKSAPPADWQTLIADAVRRELDAERNGKEPAG